MKILLIGDFAGKSSEGLSQISKRLAVLMGNHNETLNANTKNVISIKTLIKIFQFKPDVIHYVTGITIRSLIITKLLKLFLLNRPKTILSAVRVFLAPLHIKLIKYFKPDLILTQAGKWSAIFKYEGIATEFLLNPVEIEKFNKVGLNAIDLKEKYGIPADKKIILHVGHIKENRNLDSLLEISEDLKVSGYKVVIVSSPSFHHDEKLIERLIKAEFIIIKGFIDKIEEFYNIADIYFFPVKGLSKNYFPKTYNEVGVIDTPLSVLEAIAVGIPIVTSEIDSLNLILDQNTLQNLVVWDGLDNLVAIFNRMVKLNIHPYGETAMKFSSQKVASDLNHIYNSLIV